MNSKLDNFDRAILRVLQRDSSLSMDALSELVNLSRNACWRRVRALEEAGVIRDRVVLLDPSHLDLSLQVFVMVRTRSHDPAWLEEFARAVKALPEIIGAHRMSGDLDYVLRVRVADVAGYDAFYQRLISKIPVADISASFVMDDIKDGTALPV